jgi:hypothetical protein
MKFEHMSLLFVLVVATACSTANYQSPQFAERAQRHQIIAVLPFEMVLEGEMPRGLTIAQIARIEEDESIAFQTAYYHCLLNQASAHRKHPIRVQIQSIEETNRLLKAEGIEIRESWGMSAKSLARVLRVDAVISTTVNTTRYLSGGESFAIDTGLQVVNEVSEGLLAPFLPWGLSTTHNIWANSELIDSLDGSVMWQSDISVATDWRAPPNDIITGFTADLAKKFPYRG